MRKNIDKNLLLQSIPSLLVSLVGLAFSGKMLNTEQSRKYAATFPIILISNCLLSFKGNIELIYAMYLSSSTQVQNHTIDRYLKYAFENGCLVLTQSIVIGISIGLLGLARNVIGNVIENNIFPRMMAVCVLSSFLSTVIIVVLLVPAVLVALELGINPDNIVLPVIASLGDFVDIAILILLIRQYQFASVIRCCIPIFLIFGLIPFLIYISMKSSKRIPIQSVYVLVITYILGTLSSYIIQVFSKRHTILASSYPIFCGLAGASSYVYLNRKVTSIQNMVPHDRRRSFNSVILASIIVAFAATLLMPAMGIYFKKMFSIMFVIGFVITVSILLKVIDVIMKFCEYSSDIAGVIGLPMIASIADFLGSFVLLAICFIVFGP